MSLFSSSRWELQAHYFVSFFEDVQKFLGCILATKRSVVSRLSFFIFVFEFRDQETFRELLPRVSSSVDTNYEPLSAKLSAN